MEAIEGETWYNLCRCMMCTHMTLMHMYALYLPVHIYTCMSTIHIKNKVLLRLHIVFSSEIMYLWRHRTNICIMFPIHWLVYVLENLLVILYICYYRGHIFIDHRL